jgi:hypothetical protein
MTSRSVVIHQDDGKQCVCIPAEVLSAAARDGDDKTEHDHCDSTVQIGDTRIVVKGLTVQIYVNDIHALHMTNCSDAQVKATIIENQHVYKEDSSSGFTSFVLQTSRTPGHRAVLFTRKRNKKKPRTS